MSGGEENIEVQELPQELKDIKNILYQARAQNILTKGIRQCLKVIENGKAMYCFIAEDCDNAQYTDLLKAICAEKGVKVINVPQREQLGEWTHQGRIRDGDLKKVVKCSSAVVGVTLRTSDEVKRLNAKTN